MRNDKSLEVAFYCFITAAILFFIIVFTGCSTLSKTARGMGELGRSAETLIDKKCGNGGKTVLRICDAKGDKKCGAFVDCYNAVRSLHAYQVGVLALKLSIEIDSSDDKKKAALKKALKLFEPIRGILKNWGIDL